MVQERAVPIGSVATITCIVTVGAGSQLEFYIDNVKQPTPSTTSGNNFVKDGQNFIEVSHKIKCFIRYVLFWDDYYTLGTILRHSGINM